MPTGNAGYELLPGLPPYGPPAITFSNTGWRTYSEGFVVRFVTASGETWVGNFIGTLQGCNPVVRHPDGQHWLVIANGEGYVVDPEARRCVGRFGGQVQWVLALPDLDCVVIADLIQFNCFGPSGLKWRSDRVSWDGMRNLAVEADMLSGEAYDPSDDWMPFVLNLATGEVKGGSFCRAEARDRFRPPEVAGGSG